LPGIAIRILFIAPFAKIIEPRGGIRGVRWGEGPVGGGGRVVSVVVSGECGIPDRAWRGEVVYSEGCDGAGVGSWDGEVGVAADGTVDDGARAVLGDRVVGEDLATLLTR
jgi:hypothetical protein